MKLYAYWQSSTSYRVRAALNLKAIPYEEVDVDLLKGAQLEEEFRALNPAAGVPALVLEDGTVLTQSLAILDHIDTVWPEPALLPSDPVARAHVHAQAQVVALDIHPINNTRVLSELRDRFDADSRAVVDWMHHWMARGFAALEVMLPQENAARIANDGPNLADLCITAQAYNAYRWRLDLTSFPKVAAIEAACLNIPAIAAAHPYRHPNADKK